MLLRGVGRRCAWCGGRGAFFTSWTAKSDRCHTCGLNWRRGDVGFELGAATAAAILCMGPLLMVLAAMVAISWPEVHVLPMFIVLGLGAVILPVVLYPVSYSTWQAVDIMMRPVEPEHFDVPAALEESLAESNSESPD